MFAGVILVASLCFSATSGLVNPIDLIKENGYPAETHEVITEDGYIIVLHRIPHGISNSTIGPPIVITHGLGSSSADFVNAGPGKSYSYVLADAGYDVWLSNARGNSYSNKHVTLDPIEDAQQFYNFSWHEIGSLDLPAQIDYILNVTGEEKLFYSSHSQGGTAFYIMGSERPEYNEKIRLASLLAPSAMLDHTDILLRLISQFIYELEDLANVLHLYSLPFPELIRVVGSTFCSIDTNLPLCTFIYNVLSGYSDPEQTNSTLIPIMLRTSPSDLPLKSLFHYGQVIKEGVFQQYNYRNGTPKPYNLADVTAPVAIYYGPNDLFIKTEDINTVIQLLSNVVRVYLVDWERFSHLDCLYAIDAVPLLYNPVLELMSQY